jgi:hypothetical protein
VLLVGLFQLRDMADVPVATRLRRLVTATLALSEATVARAGGAVDLAAPAGQLVVPPAITLESLRVAVSWTNAELDALLSPLGVATGDLDPLVTELPVPMVSDLEDGPLLRQPFARAGERVIVAAPGAIPAALQHCLLRLAQADGVLPLVAAAFRRALNVEARRALARLGCRPLGPVAETTWDGIPVLESSFDLDVDARLRLFVVGDPLDDVDDLELQGSWLDAALALGNIFDATAEAHAATIATETQSWRDDTLLVVIASPGRSVGIPVPNSRPGVHCLALSLTALEVMAHVERGDPLAVNRFARACASRTARYIGWNVLDEYAHYIANDHSFYESDEGRPTMVSLAVGSGRELRERVIRETRPRSVVAPDPRLRVEVRAQDRTLDSPIFVPGPSFGRIARVVAGLGTDVWFVGPPEIPNDRFLVEAYDDLVETAAYWLWQMADGLRPALESLAQDVERVVVEFEWQIEERADQTDDEEPAIDIGINRERGDATVRLTSGTRLAAVRADNAFDRFLAATIAAALRGLAEGRIPEENDPQLRSLIDRQAPPGLKKMLLAFDPVANSEIGLTEVPDWRRVAAAESDEILDQLGEDLVAKGYHPAEVGTAEDQVELLNAAVASLFERFTRAVAELDPDGLLEWLLAHNDALVRAFAMLRFRVPARLTAYGDRPDVLEGVERDLRDLADAGIATRFLVEYVVAQPPQGGRTIGSIAFDRLIAMASAITNYGFVSDLVRHGLIDGQVRILPSKRLGVRRDDMNTALRQFSPAYLARSVRDATAGFARHWDSDEEEETPPDLARYEAAFTAEFGFGVSDLAALSRALVDIANEDGTTVVVRERNTLVAELERRLAWPALRVGDVLEQFSLRSLPAFPGSPTYDYYPWRFSRPWSYIRRPLVLRGSGNSQQVLWTARMPVVAARQLLALVEERRLQPTSDAMKALIGQLATEDGKAFVARVAASPEQRPGWIVRRNVKKVGQRRIATSTGDLGDVDILAADPSRCQGTAGLPPGRTAGLHLRGHVMSTSSPRIRRGATCG